MIITRLLFEGFRNLDDGEIYPDIGINVIFGTNAQGKTNLLEGIWLLSGNKSFRGSRDSELIQFGREFARLKIDFFAEDREQTAEILFLKGKKEVKINGIKQPSVSALIGKLGVVVFSPEHLSLVKSGPAERRKFLDNAVCQIKPSYGDILYNYNKTLANRNALLKDIPHNSQLLDTLDSWDYGLATLGASLVKMRVNYVDRLCECAGKYHSGISDNMEDLVISYNCGIPHDECRDSSTLKDILYKKIIHSRNSDLKDGFTSIGPHRDDLEILINGKNVKMFGSQGQQRSCVLSMKIAEAELIRLATSQEPIVLLDDVLSELDSKRQEFLLNKIHDRQVFISCCEAASVERLKDGRLFEVKKGVVKVV